MRTSPGNVATRVGGYFLDLAMLAVGDAAFRIEHAELGPGWLLFQSPAEVREVQELGEVIGAVEFSEEQVALGRHCVGFITYEAACAFEPCIKTQAPKWPVLAWFAAFDEPPTFWRELLPASGGPGRGRIVPEMTFEQYGRAFGRVKEELAIGTTYQVNLTFRSRFKLGGRADQFFSEICGVGPPTYAAFIHGGDWQIASFSPELFFERQGDAVVMKPMKGTKATRASRKSTAAAAQELAADEKTKSENLMIVDMVRNDLGRVAEVGSVQATDLMRVDRHGNILQVTSTVLAEVKCQTSELLGSLFPPASVTGAPKISTCSIIKGLEVSPRHIYCGSIGFQVPGMDRFSVAIRTALIDSKTGNIEYGVGSGLVWGSELNAEYEECLLKADVLAGGAAQWALLEAIHVHSLSHPELLADHLARISASADHFRIPLDIEGLRAALMKLKTTLIEGDGPKIRVAVDVSGKFEISVGKSDIDKPVMSAAVAKKPVCSSDPNLRHKTTSRAVYEAHLDAAPEFDEVLLYNELGQVTEFCRGNVVLRFGDRFVTPQPNCGCLAGIGVGQLVRSGKVELSIVSVPDANRADEVFFVNAVTGMIPVSLDLSASPLAAATSPQAQA